MSETRELEQYIGISVEDRALLRRLLEVAEPEIPAIIENFYAAIQRSAARGVLQDEAQVQRLKSTLCGWIRETLSGPHDDAYWERHTRIGRTHVRVGLSHRYVFAALNLIRGDLQRTAHALLPGEECMQVCLALNRQLDLELAVMSSTYMQAHEDVQLRSLQDLIIRSMPVTILCLDGGGRVTAATRPSARLFGDNAEIGRHYEAFLPSDLVEAADLPSMVGQCLSTGQELSVPRVVLGEGPLARHFRISIVPLHHELARLLLHIEETSEAVQAEARAQQAESLARIGSLAANVAHEIRNPLTAISTTLQVISGSFPAEDRRKAILGKVGEQVLRLDRLVSDLLGYARKAVPQPRRLDLMELCREARTAAGVEAELAGSSALVVADPGMVSQILINLLQNARDAGGGVRIQVEGGRVGVIDGGPGAPVDLGEKIFEPFVTTKTRGTGLGLAISRKLADAMQGSLKWRLPIAVELEDLGPGPGACFTLSLPLAG
jgi:signal transduction histidine kinase